MNLMFLILVGRINQIMNGPVHKKVINPCLGDKIATQGNTQTLRGKPYLVMLSTYYFKDSIKACIVWFKMFLDIGFSLTSFKHIIERKHVIKNPQQFKAIWSNCGSKEKKGVRDCMELQVPSRIWMFYF